MFDAEVREKTPQNLDELVCLLVAIPGNANFRAQMKATIRDYLVDCFAPFYLSANGDEEKLAEIFGRCTREAK